MQEVCSPPPLAAEPRPPALADGPARAAAYTAALLVALWAAKAVSGRLAGFGPVGRIVGELLLGAAIAAEVILPARRCDAHGLPLAAVGLDFGRWRHHLRGAAGLLACVLPLYLMATYAWLQWAQPALAAGWGSGGTLSTSVAKVGTAAGGWSAAAHATIDGATLPAIGQVSWRIIEQVLGVALPEEVFFRGYLLPQLWRRWPSANARQALCGPAAWLAASAFALAHWLGEWQPQRLLPLFPGLLFGQLAWRQSSVVGAIAAHAGCNLAAQLVWKAWAP